MFKKKNISGFTLVELLVSVFIVGILFSIVLISLNGVRNSSSDAKRISDILQIQLALENYYNSEGRYPSEDEFVVGEQLKSSASEKVFMEKIPFSLPSINDDCFSGDYIYREGTSFGYELIFCIGGKASSFSPGYLIANSLGLAEVNSNFECGDDFLDIRDGNNYSTVQIGTQCWMSENLRYLPEVSPSVDGSVASPHYYVYGYEGHDIEEAKKENNYNVYGVLYNWPAAMAGSTSEGSQGSCPDNWYIPTDNDFKMLEGFIDSSYGIGDPIWDNIGWRGSDAALKLKHDSWGGDDEFRFSALPSGSRNIDGSFFRFGTDSYLWSSSTLSRRLSSSFLVSRYQNNASYGFSVRCLKLN